MSLRFKEVGQGCAEGRSPFAEGLGVSPNFLLSPQEWGHGVDRKRARLPRSPLSRLGDRLVNNRLVKDGGSTHGQHVITQASCIPA
jgi:hypothetical protein